LKQSVRDEIVKNDLCIGCGVCAGICPQKVLKIEDNKYGEYNPCKINDCSLECGLCMKVCPFGSNENETELGAKIYGDIEGIKNLSETGYYLESYAGYSNEFRQSSASGGITSWLLTELLRKKVVDYIVCPTSQKNPNKLFDFEIFSDESSVKNVSGSVYYPVEMSQVIQKILEKPGRYAITGLPCFLKGLRLAAQKNRKLGDRIIVTIGLTCGQIKSKHYTAYLSKLANVEGKLTEVYYRGKDPEKPANNYYFYCSDEKGTKGKIFFKDRVVDAWVNRWFTPRACNFCDDIFAELADVTLMDAWLPEYISDSQGTNLLIVRSKLIQGVISDGIKNNSIVVDEIPIDKVIKSQPGVIDVKRKQLAYRLHMAQRKGLKIPSKRIKASNNIGFFMKKDVEVKDEMQRVSRDHFIDNFSEAINLQKFQEGMKPLICKARFWKLIKKIHMRVNSSK
jgi:coenzyme F420 hydrogenase subunit beta